MALGSGLVVLFASTALADAIQVNGIWMPDCRVQSSDGVELRYVDVRGVDRRRLLSEVQGVKLEAYPDYHDAVALVAKGQDRLAQRLLEDVLSKAQGRNEWLAADAAQRLVALYDRGGNGAKAARVYLDAAARRPAMGFLNTPPLGSVAALSPADREALRPRIERALRSAGADAAGPIGRLQHAALTGVAPQSKVKEPAASAPVPFVASSRQPAGPAYADAMVRLPLRLGRSEVADLLVAGQPDAALSKADAALRLRASDEMLFLRGLARLHSAQRSGNVSVYKDAALDFLRVVVVFPHGAYVGPSLVEAAAIHQKFSRPQAVTRLLEEAGVHLDPAKNPRYDKFRRELIAAG
ncbi:MAG: hypothetical protein V3V20_09025 [Algisphaera sp.]